MTSAGVCTGGCGGGSNSTGTGRLSVAFPISSGDGMSGDGGKISAAGSGLGKLDAEVGLARGFSRGRMMVRSRVGW